MNESNPTPPPIPPEMNPPFAPTNPPLGTNPAEREPIPNFISAIESILRHPRRISYHLSQPQSGRIIGVLLGIAVVCSLLYGVVVGTFSGDKQLWIAPLKISCGVMFTALICLPSLYIFSCLSGSRARLAEVAGLLAGLLALLTVLLVGFAPVALVFSTSTSNLAAMGALHLIFGLIATIFGLRFLYAGLEQFGARSSGSVVWSFIFVIVLLQMTTALRPILGTSDTLLPGLKEKKLFIGHWMECIDAPNPLVKPPKEEPRVVPQ